MNESLSLVMISHLSQNTYFIFTFTKGIHIELHTVCGKKCETEVKRITIERSEMYAIRSFMQKKLLKKSVNNMR